MISYQSVWFAIFFLSFAEAESGMPSSLPFLPTSILPPLLLTSGLIPCQEHRKITSLSIFLCICTHIYTYIYIHLSMCVYIYIYMCVYLYMSPQSQKGDRIAFCLSVGSCDSCTNFFAGNIKYNSICFRLLFLSP